MHGTTSTATLPRRGQQPRGGAQGIAEADARLIAEPTTPGVGLEAIAHQRRELRRLRGWATATK
eukprot:4253746-Prorocentrum_lima.AAC.1